MTGMFKISLFSIVLVPVIGCASGGGKNYNDLARCSTTGENFMIKRQKMQRDDFGPTMGVNDQVSISENLPIECLEYYQ